MQALSLPAPSSSWCHVDFDPGFLNERQPLEIKTPLKERHRLRRRAMSARPCSRANSVFLKPQSFMPQEPPHHIM